MDKNSIAAQLFTLRNFLKTREDVEDTFRKVKKMGYQSIQVSGMGYAEPNFIKDLTHELDLKICATHVSFDRLKNDFNSVVNEHKLWDCEYVGIGSMPQEFRNKDGYFEFAREASIIGEKLSHEGLNLIYHNHNFEFEKFNGLTGLEILINETDGKKVGFELDTYWVQAGGGSPVEYLKKLKGRIDVVHFKDMEFYEGKTEMAEIGEGNLDWPSIIEVCRENNVKWYAIEQDTCRRSPFESLEMSLNYLSNYLTD
ncbi:MAG: sugar phosphate isomerase/epimerase [Clostridia bacterium]|jgi:sugar phosphate isomerase/epimerase